MSEQKALSRTEFLNRGKDRPLGKEFVPIPEFGEGCGVWVRELSAKERTQFERQHEGKHAAEVREHLVIRTCINEDGTPMFEYGDSETLASFGSSVMERLVNAASGISNVSEADIMLLAGNSHGTKDGSSP